MSWLFFSTLAYFLTALEVILDKFILSSRRISHPSVYAFYSGMLSIFTLLLFPFGFHGLDWPTFLIYLFPGLVFCYGLVSLFYAIQENEASRVTPVVGAIIPIVTYFFSFWWSGEVLSGRQMAGVLLLVLGGLLISFKRKKGGGEKLFGGFFQAALAGILLALSFFIFKQLYLRDNFINVFIWTRGGFVLGALSLLLVPFWREKIIKSLREFRKPKKEEEKTGALFVFNKIIGGIASILLNFSISLGSVVIINALVSLEYVFVFILGLLFSFWKPKIFEEKRGKKIILQKIMAIGVVSAGLILVSG